MRLILSHTLIVFLCLVIVAIAVFILLREYQIRFAVARLDDMTVPIYIQARSLAQGQASLDEVWVNLEDQAQETGVFIFLVDSEGNIIRQAPSGGGAAQLEKLPSGALPSDISQPYHGTYRAPKRQTYVFAAYPFAALFGSQNPSIPDILVLAVPLRGALILWAGFAEPFLWAGLIAIAVSVVLAIILARTIYRPVQRVTEAAEKIAQGHYEQQVPVTGPKEVKRLALRFNQMTRQVQQSQQRLRDFVADVSHELRSPLTAIRGFAQAMVDGTVRDSESHSRSAQIIQDESMRMIRLVDDLLELSRIESGQIQMSREPVDVAGLAQHCHELFAIRAQEKGVILKMELEQVPSIVGDIDRLEQVFSNLLDNALKHTPRGEQVIISAQQASADLVKVTVADTGPGIAPEELPRVFERFYQADARAGKGGTGLGLAIAREIVRAHGGDIEARNASGGGAEFIVRLPTNPS
jgi:signal transduction histidine kinase